MSAPANGLARLAHAARPDRPWLAGALAASAVLHAFAAVVVPRPVQMAPRTGPAETQVIDIETAPPPAPKPMAAPPPPPAPAKERAPARAAAKSPAHEGPPPLAQAGQVLTRKPAAAEPLDFTNAFVTGSAAAYAGGTTAATGTSRSVVRDATAPPAPVAGPPDAPAGSQSGGDLSRPPSMASDSTWKCPFPPEANAVDQAVVQLRVFVDGGGKALDAAVLVDPGHGFGAEAVRCAMGSRWRPALDRAGTPIRATAIVRVRFTR